MSDRAISNYYENMDDTKDKCRIGSPLEVIDAAERCLGSMMIDAKVKNFLLLGEKMDFMTVCLNSLRDIFEKSVDSN